MDQAKPTTLAPAKAALVGLVFAILFLVAGGAAVVASYDNDGGSHGVDLDHSEDDVDHSEEDADLSEDDADHSEELTE